MTAAHRNNGSRMKQRWKDSEVVASRLGLTKFQVYNHLMTVIVEKGWLDGAKNGDAEIVEAIKALPEWQRMINPIHVMEEEEEEERPRERSKYAKHGKDGDLSAGEKINIAFWMIKKIGSVAEAKIALDVAAQAVEKLEAKTERLK